MGGGVVRVIVLAVFAMKFVLFAVGVQTNSETATLKAKY